MRNDHILFENNAVAFAEKSRSRHSKKEKIENVKLSNIEVLSRTVIHNYNSIL